MDRDGRKPELAAISAEGAQIVQSLMGSGLFSVAGGAPGVYPDAGGGGEDEDAGAGRGGGRVTLLQLHEAGIIKPGGVVEYSFGGKTSKATISAVGEIVCNEDGCDGACAGVGR